MDTWPRREGEGGSQYIPRLHITKEYIPLHSLVRCNRGIFLSTDKCMGIYSSELYSSVILSVNRGI
jgi:hypothetical protein